MCLNKVYTTCNSVTGSANLPEIYKNLLHYEHDFGTHSCQNAFDLSSHLTLASVVSLCVRNVMRIFNHGSHI